MTQLVKDHLHEIPDGDQDDPAVLPSVSAADVDSAIAAALPVAAFVDPLTATAGEVAQALIDAGLMAPA
jgi:hypothetical protein